MDVLTVLEAARAPLTIEEIKQFSGVMFSQDRLEQLILSGDIKRIPEIPDVYYAVPYSLRKRRATRNCTALKTHDRSQIIADINTYREKLQQNSSELDALQLKKDTFPSQEQLNAHMQRLHKYNDAKDMGMLLLGHLAELEGVKVQKLYEDYGIDPED